MNHRVATHCATKLDYRIHAGTKLIGDDSAFSLANVLLRSDASVKALSRLSGFSVTAVKRLSIVFMSR